MEARPASIRTALSFLSYPALQAESQVTAADKRMHV